MVQLLRYLLMIVSFYLNLTNMSHLLNVFYSLIDNIVPFFLATTAPTPSTPSKFIYS